MIAVEEDGEDIFTPMQRQCTRWECQYAFGNRGANTTLAPKGGFMCCPNCGVSYGPAPPQPPEPK